MHSTTILHKRVFFVVGFLLMETLVCAGSQQEVKPENVLEMSFEELMDLEVTIATKTKKTIETAPSSVTVFTRNDIINMGITSLQELLNYVPGFQATRDVEQGTSTRISVRGRGTALSEYVLFLINGQRMNDLYSGGVSILNRRIAVGNIKQVEIIRGPGSALYGSNAFLGIVNIVTLEDTNDLTVGAGNLNSRNMAVNISRRLSDDLSVSGFISAFSDEGQHYHNLTGNYGIQGNTDDPVKGYDLSVRLKYADLTVDVRHMERSLENFLTFGNLANYTNNETSKQSSIAARYGLPVGDRLKVDIMGGYSQDRWRSLTINVPRGIELAPGFSLDQHFFGGPLLESYNANLNTDISYELSQNNQLLTGISYERTGITDVAQLGNHHPVSLDYHGDIIEYRRDGNFNEERTRDIWGLYLQDQQSLGENLEITAGLRYDRYSDFGDAVNPRAAIIYRIGEDSSAKVMYGQAFRAPNFLELYDRNNPVDFGNANLEAEKVETFELAYTRQFERSRADVTFFSNRFRDMIVMGDPVVHVDNPLEAPAFENESGVIETKGVELEYSIIPIDNMMIRGSYTHLLDGENLPMPENFASLIANYRINKVNLNLNGIYRERFGQLPEQDSYFLVNTTIQYLVTANFTLFASVMNITDETYNTITSVLEDGVENRGRTYLLGARLTF